MARLILTLGNGVLREIALVKGGITIGRGTHNDIIIDDLAISVEHAAIITTESDSSIEDLNSTNGTKVNGQPVKKHFLQNRDVIGIAQYYLQFVTQSFEGISGERAVAGKHFYLACVPRIKLLNGPDTGKEAALTKNLVTIGHPGVQVALIARRVQRYYLGHMDGNRQPLVNGKPIGVGLFEIANEDVIDLSGIQMQFLWTAPGTVDKF